jgi:hypothetical protein
MAVYLRDLPVADPDLNLTSRSSNLHAYAALPGIGLLGWPEALVEQFLFDHCDNDSFRHDYENLDLSTLHWAKTSVETKDLLNIPTGPSDQGFLESVAANHAHWVSVRPRAIQEAWKEQGTWLVPPILIARKTLSPGTTGLQVIEGRMRIGILQGRAREGLRVADTHEAWIAQ